MKKFAFIISGIIIYTSLFAQYKKVEIPENKENQKEFGFTKISNEKYLLDNGLVVLINEDHSDPVVSLHFLHQLGSSASYSDRTVSMYLMAYLLYESNGLIDSDFYTQYGGSYKWGIQIDKTMCEITIPSDLFESALARESKRLFEFIPSQSQIHFQSTVETIVQQEMNKQFNDGLENAKIYSRRALYPFSHPYSWQVTGTTEHYQSAELFDIQKFYSDWIGANNMILAVSGDIEAEEAVNLVSDYFGKFSAAINPADQVGTQIDLMNSSGINLLTENRYITNFLQNTEIKTPVLRMVYPTLPKYTQESVALELAALFLEDGKSGSLSKLLYSANLAENVHVYHESYRFGGEFVIEIIAKPGVSLKTIKDTVEYSIRNSFLLPQHDEQLKIKDGDLESIRKSFEKRQFEVERNLQTMASFEILKLLSGLEMSAKKAKLLAAYEFYLKNPNSLSDEIFSIGTSNASKIFEVSEQFIVDKPAVVVSVLPKGEAVLKAGIDNHKIHKLESVVQPTTAEEIANLKFPTAVSDKSKLRRIPVYPFPVFTSKKLENGLKYMISSDSESPFFSLVLMIDFNNIRTLLENPLTPSIVVGIFREYINEFMNGEIISQLKQTNSTIDFKFMNNHLFIEVESAPHNINFIKEILREMVLSNQPIIADMERVVNNIQGENTNPSLDAHQLFSSFFMNRLFPVENMLQDVFITKRDELLTLSFRLMDRIPFLLDPNESKLFITGNAPEGQISDLIEHFRQWQSVPTGDVIAQIPGDTMPFEKHLYYTEFKQNDKATILINYLNLAVDDVENTRAGYVNYMLGIKNGLLKNYLAATTDINDFGSYDKITGNVHSYYLKFNTTNENTSIRIQEILKQINDLALVKTDKKKIKIFAGQYLRLEDCKYESSHSKAILLNIIDIEKRSEDYFVMKNKIVKKTKGGKLKKFVSKNINEDEFQIFVMGNSEKLYDQFKDAHLGPVTELNTAGKVVSK